MLKLNFDFLSMKTSTQPASTTSTTSSPNTVCPPLQVGLSSGLSKTKPYTLLLSPTIKQTANLASDAITPLSITGTIHFDEVGMCELEDMAGFIAATELVLAETVCVDHSSQMCTVRIVSGRWCGDILRFIVQSFCLNPFVTNPHNSSLRRASGGY